MTEWADCAICGCTTEPGGTMPGFGDTGDVVVVGRRGNGESCIDSARSRACRQDWRTT